MKMNTDNFLFNHCFCQINWIAYIIYNINVKYIRPEKIVLLDFENQISIKRPFFILPLSCFFIQVRLYLEYKNKTGVDITIKSNLDNSGFPLEHNQRLH